MLANPFFNWQRNYAISRAFFCKPILSTTPGINFRSTNPLLILLIHKIKEMLNNSLF